MIKKLLLATIFIFLLNGCGSGPSDESSEVTLNDHPTTPTVASIKDYNLWEYMVPSSNRVNNFSLYNNNSNEPSETYSTSYTVSKNLVQEVSSYSPDEKTVYEKRDDEIVISFQKDNSSMGFFTMELQANLDEMVTKKTSDCKLEKHYLVYDNKFEDVIEIVCGSQHGFYQKGVGEIAQVIQDQSSKTLRILSN